MRPLGGPFMVRASSRLLPLLFSIGAALSVGGIAACAAKAGTGGFDDTDGGVTGGSSSGALGDGGQQFGGDGGTAAPPDGSVTVTTTIYANTDDSLYTLDPKTHAVTLV